jgi:hypothetical protein
MSKSLFQISGFRISFGLDSNSQDYPGSGAGKPQHMVYKHLPYLRGEVSF